MENKIVEHLCMEYTYERDGVVRTYRRQMHHDDLYRALGLDPKKHLPDEGVFDTDIAGTIVYVIPKEALYLANLGRVRKRRFMKRTFAICSDCGKRVEAGHLHQHRKIHK